MRMGCERLKSGREGERAMKAEEALEVVPKICDALQFAHEEGVVHRDLKPENILVDKRGGALAGQAIKGIAGSDAHDRAAEECALLLAKQGEINDARAIAEMIAGNESRDRVLSAIAKGQ